MPKVFPSISSLCVIIVSLFHVQNGEASWLGRLSLTTMEGYTDNLQFSEKNEKDFVSRFIPTMTFIHKSPWQDYPDFAARLSVAGEYFAQHPALNNFGDNLEFNAAYVYPYSSRLNFVFSDRFERLGESRIGDAQGGSGRSTNGSLNNIGSLIRLDNVNLPSGLSGGLGGMGALGGLEGVNMGKLSLSGGSACRRSGAFGGRTGFSQNDSALVNTGKLQENQTSVEARVLYSSLLAFRANYCWEDTTFISAGGGETAHSIEFEGSYLRWRQHNLRARYTLSALRSRDGHVSLVHDFDFGDNYWATQQIQLTPTLTLSAATGLALLTNGGNGQNGGRNRRKDKFRLENKLDVDLVKIWKAASFAVGVRRGLTNSLGVSGPSFTTSFYSVLAARLTRRLNGTVGAVYSMYDTEDTSFNTLQTFAALQYMLTSWVSMNVIYSYRQLDSGSGSTANDFHSRGLTSGNLIFLSFSASFDIWPDVGFAKSLGSSLTSPDSTSPSSGFVHP